MGAKFFYQIYFPIYSAIIPLMKLKFFKKYFSIIFVVATLMGVFHQHNDLKTHTDCQICTVQSNMIDGDIPTQKVYFHTINQSPQAILSQTKLFQKNILKNQLKARAPPQIS